MPIWAKWILGWLWDKLIPIVVDWTKKTFRKQQIKKDVDKETKSLEELRKEAKEYLKENGGNLPKEMENRLRDAARRRRDGLQ